VTASTAIRIHRVPGGVTLSYPPAVVERDLTYRPPIAAGRVLFVVGGQSKAVVVKRGRVFGIPSGMGTVVIPAGGARDAFGNRNGARFTVRP
jgi:hypothetical protein